MSWVKSNNPPMSKMLYSGGRPGRQGPPSKPPAAEPQFTRVHGQPAGVTVAPAYEELYSISISELWRSWNMMPRETRILTCELGNCLAHDWRP